MMHGPTNITFMIVFGYILKTRNVLDKRFGVKQNTHFAFNSLALELAIYSLAHHLCKM